MGAVSPGGWGVPAMRASLDCGSPLPVQFMPRPGWEKPLPIRAIPSPFEKPAFLAHARLRRASPMTHYAVGAALEALGSDADLVRSGKLRLGIIACTMNGGLCYSRRFYQEALQSPGMASPLLFPETVFNAPASHLSAFLGVSTVNYTIVGDAGVFLQGLAIAAQWLDDAVAEACLVIGAEEADWTAADALRLFDRHAVHAGGAGALYLTREASPETAIELTAITNSIPIGRETSAAAAGLQMRSQLPAGNARELLCSSENDDANWPNWPGARLAPKAILGEAFVASAAWQCVAACDALQRCQHEAANVIITSPGQPAIAARFFQPNPIKTEQGQQK